MGSLFLRALIGGTAGLLAWVLIEPTSPGLVETVEWTQFETRFILAVGALIGLAVGGYNGFLQGGRTHILRGLILGAVFGLIGAPLGFKLGGGAALLFGGTQHGFWPLNIPGRIAVMSLTGVALGAGIGFSSLDPKRAAHGAIGGAIAGIISGSLFDLVGVVFSGLFLGLQGIPAGQRGEVGQVGRAIFAVSIGLFIGLFIGLVEYYARSAWVRMTLGRNEGREWPIFGSHAVIGRREGVQIPIFGDPGIAPEHAVIVKQGRDYFLRDAGSGAPTFLNGVPVAEAPLSHGSEIMVGSTRLHFLLKGKQAPAPAQAPVSPTAYAPTQAYQPQAVPVQPMPMPPTQAMQPMPHPPMQPTVAFAPQGGPTMVALDGPLAGQRVPLNQPMELGRESSVLPMSFDSSASRKHATIAPTPGGIVVNDLGSTNGTYVNGQRISQPTTIRPGDHVRIGATTFRVE